MWLLRIAEELSVGLNSPVEDSPFVLSPHIPDSPELFLRLEVSFGTTIATGQALVDLRLAVK